MVVSVIGLGWYPFLLQSRAESAGYVHYCEELNEIARALDVTGTNEQRA